MSFLRSGKQTSEIVIDTSRPTVPLSLSAPLSYTSSRLASLHFISYLPSLKLHSICDFRKDIACQYFCAIFLPTFSPLPSLLSHLLPPPSSLPFPTYRSPLHHCTSYLSNCEHSAVFPIEFTLDFISASTFHGGILIIPSSFCSSLHQSLFFCKG